MAALPDHRRRPRVDAPWSLHCERVLWRDEGPFGQSAVHRKDTIWAPSLQCRGMPFTGIPPEAIDFYVRLEADNSKVFWEANKAVYRDQVKATVEALCAELEEYGPFHLFRP